MSKPLRVGILLADIVQLLDLAAVDLLYMTSPEYLVDLGLPTPLIDLGRPCQIHYIGQKQINAPLTSQTTIPLTNTLTDEEVAPGNLDILYLPGSPPKNMPPPEAYLDFLRRHSDAGVTILSICTAALIVAHAGLAAGRTVTAPRFLIPQLRKQFPDAVWDDSVRFTRHGNLWMSGGITNGHDLIAEYLRVNYPAPLVNTILAAADVPLRPAEYETKATTDTLYMVWQVMRALPYTVVNMVVNREYTRV
ncbi:hypothetical protein N7495_009666 [Penicillium taxi]|uniref:uncharacterized protein n=1 Tax=Penicillium taxi TaxID=168475 RepID=UPI0025454A74|nr:uncharacterized protein N7495_009666 [Penicillium taxi]KAJ5885156.1 hypothetical protein N7495_009666 [Penicillium taxi]